MGKVVSYLNVFIIFFFIMIISCKKESTTTADTTTSNRTYRMGFQNSAPRIDFNQAMQSLHLWEIRADAAIISTDVPWDTLLNGMTAVDYVNQNYKGLVDYYRTKSFKVWVYIDPANGLNRGSDATALVARKKSIAQQDMQNIYKRFVFVMDSILKPEHLGLALETNAIRGISVDSIYQGVKKAANDASVDIRNFDKNVKLSVSVQVDYAWGKLDNTSYKSVDNDFTDFPFIDELGLSSYPYFAFDKPQDIPLNYYSILLTKKSLPVFISEGGWTSATVGTTTGTTQKQSDYMIRHAQLLDQVNAIALFQLTFTDLDLSAWPANTPPNLSLFAALGLVDINFNSKPALASWDTIFKRKYSGN
jgi:hypothetical protein